jgi:hypothetical protein
MVAKDIGADSTGFNAQWDFEFVHLIRRSAISRDKLIA